MYKFIIALSCIVIASCGEPAGTGTNSGNGFLAKSVMLPSGNKGIVENGTLDTFETTHQTVTRAQQVVYSYDSIVIVRHPYVKPVTIPPIDTVPVTPPVTGYTLTYSNGFDVKTDVDDNQKGKGIWNNSFFLSGTGSFESIVNAGDLPISSGWRSEQQYGTSAQNPLEGAVEFDMYFNSWQKPGWGANCIQWHPGGNDNGGSALFFMEVCQQKWNMYDWKKGYMMNYTNTTAITAKKWYHLRFEFKWSLKSDGYFNVYIDGAKYYSYSGATQISSDVPYLKLGQNHFPGNASGSNGSPHGMDLFYDNLKIQKKN